MKSAQLRFALLLLLNSFLSWGSNNNSGLCQQADAHRSIKIRNDYSRDLTLQVVRSDTKDPLKTNWHSYFDIFPGSSEKVALCTDSQILTKILFKEKRAADSKYTPLAINDFLSGIGDKGVAISAAYFGLGGWNIESFDVSESQKIADEFQEIEDLEKSVFPAGWNDITFQRRQELKGPSYVHIKKALYFIKDQVIGYDAFFSKPRIVLFIFHGTFAAGDPQFFDVDDETFKALEQYAQSLGDSVELIAIGWSGDNENTARKNAYEYIKFIFEKLYNNPTLFYQKNMLGYSHGGNIVNLITQDDYFKNNVHNIFSIYTPVREDYTANTSSITGKLYHFYSTADPVQYGGSFKQADFSYQAFAPWWEKIGVPQLGAGFEGGRKVSEAYERDLKQQKAINYRVMVNGHSPTHLNIKPIVQNLQAIIQKTQELYHYNFDLELNIDTKNGEIDLAVRHPFYSDLVEDDAMEERLKQEERSSQEAEKRFKEKYGSDIHTKNPVRELIYSPFAG